MTIALARKLRVMALLSSRKLFPVLRWGNTWKWSTVFRDRLKAGKERLHEGEFYSKSCAFHSERVFVGGRIQSETGPSISGVCTESAPATEEHVRSRISGTCGFACSYEEILMLMYVHSHTPRPNGGRDRDRRVKRYSILRSCGGSGYREILKLCVFLDEERFSSHRRG